MLGGGASVPEVQVRAAVTVLFAGMGAVLLQQRGLHLTGFGLSLPSMQAGLWSGIFNAARAWYAARVPPPPVPSSEEEEGDSDDKEPLALAGAAHTSSSGAAAPAAGLPPPAAAAVPHK